MAAMTPSSNMALLKKVQAAYPSFTFASTDSFAWCSNTATISFDDSATNGEAMLLHELAHGLLNHREYSSDIGLLEMERQAWSYAVHTLAPQFHLNLTMDDNVVQDALDSYRDWLHARSLCPSCAAVGLESSRSHYSCIHCKTRWSVNEARTCGLRRHTQ